MDQNTFTWIIGIALTILGIAISYAVYLRNRAKDDASSGQRTGTILTEIGYIKANTDEIKLEQREQRKTNTEIVTRLTAVEQSSKQAHKRIDRLEDRPQKESEE